MVEPLATFRVGLFCCLLAAAGTARAGQQSGPASKSSDEAQEAWPSLTGSGLFSLPDTSTLRPRRLDVSVTVDNQDRDPIRLDSLDLSAAWTYGIKSRLETYGHAVVSRAVALADRPTLFPPPVDIVLPRGASIPNRPYYTVYEPFPYVSRTGS